jgi:hypothetical protein
MSGTGVRVCEHLLLLRAARRRHGTRRRRRRRQRAARAPRTPGAETSSASPLALALHLRLPCSNGPHQGLALVRCGTRCCAARPIYRAAAGWRGPWPCVPDAPRIHWSSLRRATCGTPSLGAPSCARGVGAGRVECDGGRARLPASVHGGRAAAHLPASGETIGRLPVSECFYTVDNACDTCSSSSLLSRGVSTTCRSCLPPSLQCRPQPPPSSLPPLSSLFR